VTIRPLDLADLTGVAQCADGLLADGDAFDAVILAAGVAAVSEARVGPGWELHLAVNHLGHYALVNRIRPLLPPGARIVAVSSSGHHLSPIRWADPHFATGYDKWLAYAQSKTANALFALHLDRLGRDAGIQAFSLHPGEILTPLVRHLTRAEMVRLGWINEHGDLVDPHFKTPQQGAATQLWAATSPQLAGLGGLYLEDCDVARPAPADGTQRGVREHAADPDQARQLWHLSAELTGVDSFT
jgi:NAD(P)-dependent dehydrogenase (short-subunit alcohol dehydrogenase family)